MILKRGAQGPFVGDLQKVLGFKKPDNDFGPLTEKALIEWQKKNGYASDGIASTEILVKMGILKCLTKAVNESSLNLKVLEGHIPNAVLLQIPDTAEKFNITTNLRLAHFLSQCAHESGNFKWVVEFASGKVYEGRRDLGNTHPGDGVRFKGRGYIQLTGRANYADFSKFCGEDCVANPDLVATKYPMMSAAYFFNKNKLWATCDKGATAADVKAVTKRVNGGYTGLDNRQHYFSKFWSLLNKV